eukprot:840732-Amphidinium_carterae.2
MRLLLTIARVKNYTVRTTDVASAFLNTPIKKEALVQPPKVLPQSTKHTMVTEEGIVRLENVAKTMARAIVNNPTTDGIQ